MPKKNPGGSTSRSRCLALVGLLLLAVPLAAQSPFLRNEPKPEDLPPPEPLPAPTSLYTAPEIYFLLKLPGDHAQVRYTAGSLDRAANVQTRLEISSRAYHRWANHQLDYDAYVLSREDWEKARIPIPYGVPARIDRYGIATAALGDDETVRLWRRLLDGKLPDVGRSPIRGTPAQAASLVVSDLVLQVQAAEILVDELGLGGDAHWVRGVVAHLAAAALTRRFEQGREPAVLAVWRDLGARRPLRSLAAEDYSEDLTLTDWLWYQAQFREGAMILLDEIGRGSIEKMQKLRKKGRLTERDLLEKWEGLAEWHRTTFSGVPRR